MFLSVDNFVVSHINKNIQLIKFLKQMPLFNVLFYSIFTYFSIYEKLRKIHIVSSSFERLYLLTLPNITS